MSREKSCGAIVIKKFGCKFKTLLIKHNKGHWSFPKGHVENDETEVETAVREISEETGISAEIDTGFREVSTYSTKEGAIKDVVFFIAKAKTETFRPQPEEIQQCEWVDLEDAKNLITFDNDKRIFEKALRYIKGKTA